MKTAFRIVQQRKKLLISLNTLLLNRSYLNKKIRSVKAELDSLDRFIVLER